jgi:tetratricopeptide (TPR) repeat protein
VPPRPTLIERETVAQLATAPSQTDPAYPQFMRDITEALQDPENILARILERKTADYAVRFNALYGLLHRLRREERITEYASLVARYESEFRKEPYFSTFRAIVERGRGDNVSLRHAVSLSREAARTIPKVAGVLHQVAAFAADYFERVDSTPPPREIEEAEAYADRAIEISDGRISHFFETQARLLALRGEFDSARIAVNRALELEPRQGRDYYRRITQYQATRIKIELLQQQARWHAIQDQNRRDLDEFKSEQLQLLGLLAAVVAFVVSTANIATKIATVDGIRLIQATAGALILFFATFSLMSNRAVWRVVVAYLIGVLLLAAAVELRV